MIVHAAMTTTNELMLKMKMPLETLSRSLGSHSLKARTARPTQYATRVVCQRYITYDGLQRFANPRMKLATIKLFVAPIARMPISINRPAT
jgi:hypothetical protein